MATFIFWKAVAAHPQIYFYAYLWARHDWINRPAYDSVISCSLGGERDERYLSTLYTYYIILL
jgi:hypothetical protein